MSATTIARTSAPSSWPAVVRSAIGTFSELRACVAKSQAAIAPAASAPTIRTAAPRRRSGTTPNQSTSPIAAPPARRAIGEQQRQQQHAHRRVGQRPEQRVAGAAGAEPHAADRAHRGRQAEGVPVPERFARAGRSRSPGPAGPGGSSSAARSRRRATEASATPAEQRRPAARSSRTSAIDAPNTARRRACGPRPPASSGCTDHDDRHGGQGREGREQQARRPRAVAASAARQQHEPRRDRPGSRASARSP